MRGASVAVQRTRLAATQHVWDAARDQLVIRYLFRWIKGIGERIESLEPLESSAQRKLLDMRLARNAREVVEPVCSAWAAHRVVDRLPERLERLQLVSQLLCTSLVCVPARDTLEQPTSQELQQPSSTAAAARRPAGSSNLSRVPTDRLGCYHSSE